MSDGGSRAVHIRRLPKKKTKMKEEEKEKKKEEVEEEEEEEEKKNNTIISLVLYTASHPRLLDTTEVVLVLWRSHVWSHDNGRNNSSGKLTKSMKSASYLLSVAYLSSVSFNPVAFFMYPLFI